MRHIEIRLSEKAGKRRCLQGLLISIFTCTSSIFATAQSQQDLTPSTLNISGEYLGQSLIDIIEQSYNYHPDLLRRRAELDIIKEDVALSRSAYLPQVTAQGSIRTSERDSLLQNGDDFSQNTTPKELSLQFSQTLFTGGRRRLNKNVAKISYEAAKAEYKASSINVAEEIINSYTALIEAQQSADILNKSVISLQQLEHVISTRQKAGDSSVTDIAQTTARLATAKAQKAAVQAQLIQAREELSSISGQFINSATIPSQAIEPYHVSLEQSVAIAREKNPLIKSRKLTEQAAKYQLRAQKKGWIPTVALDASARSIRDSSPTIDEDDDLRIGINVTMPLYQGGQGASNIRRAQARINSAKFNVDNNLRINDIQITNLHSRLKNSREVLKYQVENMTANQSAYDGIFAAERAGLADIRDVLQAQQNTLTAELAHAQALNSLYQIRLLLRLYTGELAIKDVTKELPKEVIAESSSSLNPLIWLVED